MDEQLSQILVHTYNPDPNLRAQAEAALKQFLAQQGALTYLIQLARRVDVQRDLRYLKTCNESTSYYLLYTLNSHSQFSHSFFQKTKKHLGWLPVSLQRITCGSF